MKIHQVSVTYVPEQDRMLVRINTTDAEELSFWLTRRLLTGLWPLMNQALAVQLSVPASPMPGVTTGDSMRHMLVEFRKDALKAQADFSTPYRAEDLKNPLGAVPLLVTEVKVSHRPGNLVQIDLAELLPQSAPPRSFKLELDPSLLQGIVQLIEQALPHSDWRIAPPGADLPAELPVPGEAPDNNDDPEPESSRPRYLN